MDTMQRQLAYKLQGLQPITSSISDDLSFLEGKRWERRGTKRFASPNRNSNEGGGVLISNEEKKSALGSLARAEVELEAKLK